MFICVLFIDFMISLHGQKIMKGITYCIVSILILFSAGNSYSYSKKDFKAFGIQELKEEAPNFTIADPNGKRMSMKDYRGKAVILHFWATWCNPCKDEFPLFEKLYQNFKDREIVFLPISIDLKAGREEVEKFAKGHGLSCQVYLAREGDVTNRYWTWGVPVTYFINKKGWIIGRALGPRDWASDKSNEIINSLIEDM